MSERMAQLVFTGAAGATSYAYGKSILERGDQVRIELDEKGKPTGHWAALIKSGNAELVKAE